jgi:hypothetical protein
MTSGRMTMGGTLWRCVACRFHHWLRAAALLSGLAFSSAVLADSSGESRDCKLAPGVRITVSVVDQAELSTELRDIGERLKELDVVLPVARETREVRLAKAGSLAGAETVRSISVTRTRNGEVTSFRTTETRPWSPATSSMSIACFPASCATRALRPGNLVYKIIKCERQPARSAGWLPASS